MLRMQWRTSLEKDAFSVMSAALYSILASHGIPDYAWKQYLREGVWMSHEGGTPPKRVQLPLCS